MEERNSRVVLQKWARQIGYAELLPSNLCGEREKYLVEENKRLYQENEKLREIFHIATVEFEKKTREIEYLKYQLKKAHDTIKMLFEENAKLKEQLEEKEGEIKILKKIAFGKKSEKQQQDKVSIGEKKRGAVAGHKGTGRKIPEGLPIKEEIIEIPEEERFCPFCGSPYQEIGIEELSSEVCVEKLYYIKRIKRKVYKKTCNCPGKIITAPIGKKLISKGKFSLDFWIEILLNKYKNHLPIERQLSNMAEYGLVVSKGTIFGGMKKIYFLYLLPVYQAMIKSIKDQQHLHIDESTWKLFVYFDEKVNYNWVIWVLVNRKVVLFLLHPTRSAEVPCKTLFDIEPDQAKLLQTIPIKN